VQKTGHLAHAIEGVLPDTEHVERALAAALAPQRRGVVRISQ